MQKKITIVKEDIKETSKDYIINSNKFKSFRDLYNNIDTEYVMFVYDIRNINLNRIEQIEKDYIFTGDLIITSDLFDYLPNKANVGEFKLKYLPQLLIDINGIIIKKELLKNININISNLKRNFKECTQIVEYDPKIQFIENVIFNTKIKKEISIDAILDIKYMSRKNDYIYIYYLINEVIGNLSLLGTETAKNVFYILKDKLNDIYQNDYEEFLSLIVSEEVKIRVNLHISLIRNCNYNEVAYFAKEVQEKNNALDVLKKMEVDVDKMQRVMKGNRIKVSLFWDKLITILRKILTAIQYWIYKPFLAYKDIWLIGERTDQAEDNAYIFFKYCREKIPNKKIYYLIDRYSIQKENVEKLGNVIYIGSLKHRVYLMHATKLISAYDFFNFLLPKDAERFKTYYMKYMNSTRIFLQHGVALNKANYYNREINKYDYILVSTVKEYNMFRYEYEYTDNQIIKIGLPRYDNLIDTSKENKNKKILFMPTWRSCLMDLSDSEFKDTEYFNAIDSLLKDKVLIKFLEKNHIEVIVYLHYQMQIYNHCFKGYSKNIIVKNREECIVQDLLKDCNLLITDFSSVGVDFSYLNKPVVFYQFSAHNFHYDINREEEYTLYNDFGMVTTKRQDVINSVYKWVENNYDNIYPINKNLFYSRGTGNNSEKIYQFINSMPKKKEQSYNIEVHKQGILKEKRVYDMNFNFIQREYYNKNKQRTSKLMYKDGYISKQIVYDNTQKCAKFVDFYKDIELETKYMDIFDESGKLKIKHVLNKSGQLIEKITYYQNTDIIKTKNKYNATSKKVVLVEEYYNKGDIKFKIIYNDEGKAIKYYYFDEERFKRREYNYYESGKVKEKIFFAQGSEQFIKKQMISEINQNIIEEIYLNKRTKKYETKNYFVI